MQVRKRISEIHVMVYDSRKYGPLAKKVIIIAAVAAFLACLNTANNAFTLSKSDQLNASSIPSLVVYLAIALLVPACGYFGAKNSNENLLGAFSCCNFCSGCLSCCTIIAICSLMSFFMGLNSAMQACNPRDSIQMNSPQCHDTAQAVDSFCKIWHVSSNATLREGFLDAVNATASSNNSAAMQQAFGDITLSPEDQQTCWDSAHSIFSLLIGLFVLAIVLSCCQMGLQCLGGYWGKQLYDVVKDGDHMDEETGSDGYE